MGKFKVKGRKRGWSAARDRAVCAARFDTNIEICDSCCCRHGILRTRATGILLNQGCACNAGRCKPRRLCSGRLKKFTPKDTKEGHCTTWFTIIDTAVRFYNGLVANLLVYFVHEHGSP